MAQREATISNPTGLHARPASQFVALAKRFSSDVRIGRAGQAPANAKSIVMVLALGISAGEVAVIDAQGEDAQEAVDQLAALIEGLEE